MPDVKDDARDRRQKNLYLVFLRRSGVKFRNGEGLLDKLNGLNA